MAHTIERLLPRVAAQYNGSRWSFWFLVVVSVLGTGRSLIHLFAPDGGAHSIAGIAIDVAGGANIVALFGQWGGSQLTMAVMEWLVILRYRFLVPGMLAIVLLESGFRFLAGSLKPLEVAAPPPGAYFTHAMLPLAALFLVLSMKPATRPRSRSSG